MQRVQGLGMDRVFKDSAFPRPRWSGSNFFDYMRLFHAVQAWGHGSVNGAWHPFAGMQVLEDSRVL